MSSAAVTLIEQESAARVRVDAAGMTHPGRRRSVNEDAYVVATLQRCINVHQASPGAQGWFPGEDAGTLLIVADGMGGYGGGDVASSVAVGAVTGYLLNALPWINVGSHDQQLSSRSSLRGELSYAIQTGDELVRTEGAHSNTPRMGTTLTMAFVLYPFVYVAHVGDTRCYLLESGRLRCLTTDHNMAQKFVEASPNNAIPPQHLQNVLWNALGGGPNRPVPDVCKVPIEVGSVLLVCSDGLNKHVSDATIRDVLGSHESCAKRAEKLIELANAGGGTDNITALVAEVQR